MKGIKNSLITLVLLGANISFGAVLKIINKSVLPLETTVYYGSSGKKRSAVIPAFETKSFNTGIHRVKSVMWNKVGEGIHHNLYAPSSIFMLSGYLEVYPEGYFIKNFTEKGIIKNGLVLYGNASSAIGRTPFYNEGKKTMPSIAQDAIERFLSAMSQLKNI
jgi:hypothetical protein